MNKLVVSCVAAIALLGSVGFCSAQVPLPANVSIVAPSGDIPKDVAAFSGKWIGTWAGTLDAILIVEEINSEKAKVLYAWGDAPSWNVKKGYWRYQASVVPGRSAELAFGDAPSFTVSMKSDMSSISITRVGSEGVIIDTFKKVAP